MLRTALLRAGRPGLALLLVLASLAQARVAHAALGDVPLAEGLSLPHLELKPAQLRAASGMDFDLLGDSGKSSSHADLNIESKVTTRRTMLTLHQASGLTTLALLTAAVVVGQLSYMDRFSGNAAGTGKYELPHTVLVTGAVTGFTATGLLGLLAPTPYPKPTQMDTVMVHKLCMIGAALGMIAETGLGLYTAGREGYVNQRQMAQIHQVIGFSTVGLMATGAGALLY